MNPLTGLQNHASALAQLLTHPPNAAPASLPVSDHQYDWEHTDNSGRQSHDTTAASSTGSGGHPTSSPPPGATVGSSPAGMPAAMMSEAVPSLGAAVQLQEASQGGPQQPQAVNAFESEAALPQGIYDLDATMQLLQQIDLETAAHQDGPCQLPQVDQSRPPQLGCVHDAAADMAIETQPRLPGFAAPAEAVHATPSGSGDDLTQVDALCHHEGKEAQILSDGGQQAGGQQRKGVSIEQQSQQQYEVLGLAAEDATSTDSEASQDDLYADELQRLGAETGGVQEQAQVELESQSVAGQSS